MTTQLKKEEGGAIVLLHRVEDFHTALKANLAPEYRLEYISGAKEGLLELLIGLRPKVVLIQYGILGEAEALIIRNWKFSLPKTELWVILPNTPSKTISDFDGTVKYYTSIGVEFVVAGTNLVPLMRSRGFCSQRPLTSSLPPERIIPS